MRRWRQWRMRCLSLWRVHTLALLSVPLLVFGFVGVTMRAGWHRPEALLAFIIYALSAVAIMFAGIADGLINSALIPEMTGASDLKLQALKAALSYNFQFNQACAKVFVVGTSLAIILWSITLFRFGVLERRIGIIGWFISLAALFGLLSGHVHMSAHGFGLIVLLQAVWAIALGVSMVRAARDVASLHQRGSSVSHCRIHDPLAPLPLA